MLMTPEKPAHDHAAQSRLLARLIRSLLARESFATLADLTAALKDDCARLRIRWTPDDISAAYRLIDAARGLPGGRPMRPIRHHVERVDDVRPLSRPEAADLCRRLGVALGREQAQEARHG
jgi:hypothetical protein